MIYSIRIWFLVAALACVAVSVRAGGSVVVNNVPLVLSAGQSVPLTVVFTKTTDEPEKRVVIRLDMHNASTHARVASAYADNAGAGITGLSGSAQCTLTVPIGAAGSFYFKATLSPWSLNRAIVPQYKSYPTNGTFTYLWSGGGYGVTQDIYYKGSLICSKTPNNTCYCSGLAYETAVIAFNAYNVNYGHAQIGNIATASNMSNFRLLWYGALADKDKLAALAIPTWGAGREITDFEEAQEGDFVQLWRMSGSGHNPVFVNWVRNSSGEITGLHYWGSQGSTNGIGFNTEYFGTTGSRMNRDRFYLGRLAKPRDQADYDWAIATATTAHTPSTVTSSIFQWSSY